MNTLPPTEEVKLDIPPQLRDHPRYRIVAHLGEGGMGTVFKAEHRMMERLVALKVVNAHLVSNPQAIERFHQEVKAAAKLSHANIVAALDADQAGDLHFLVMEYVEGVSLARLVEKKGPLAFAHACSFIRQTALGLQHAHEQGMIHRDIKPHNLMVNRKGQVKILDFGLARFATTTKDRETNRPAKALTAVDVVLGTPDFLAPEQAKDSRGVDSRADLYSLGCTLYFLLTGEVPFPGGSSIQKLFAQCEAEPEPVEKLRADLPAELGAIVRKLMAKSPDERYQSAAEVATALSAFARQGSVEQPLPMLTAATPEEEEVFAPPTPKQAAAKTQILSEDSMQETLPSMPKRREKGKLRKKRVRSALTGWLVGGVVGIVSLAMLFMLLSHLSSRAGKDKDKGEPTKTPVDPPLVLADPTKKPPEPPPVIGKPNPGVKKPRVLFVLAPFGFHYPDYGPVRETLEAKGIEVRVGSVGMEPCQPEGFGGGEPVQPDLTLREAKATDFDAIIFGGGPGVHAFTAGGPGPARPGPGGPGPRGPGPKGPGPGAQEAKRIIREMLDANKLVTALCSGPAILAEAGVLKGKKATCFDKVEDRLNQGGAMLRRDLDVVVDGLIITGRDPQAARAFAEAVAKAIKK